MRACVRVRACVCVCVQESDYEAGSLLRPDYTGCSVELEELYNEAVATGVCLSVPRPSSTLPSPTERQQISLTDRNTKALKTHIM